MNEQQCAECLTPSASLVATRGGAAVCATCAAEHYVACAACGGLVPDDETRSRAGKRHCLACDAELATPKDDAGAAVDVDALVAEYVALDAEAKRIDARLDAIKETLKTVAAARDRVAGAVTLGAGESNVKVSYSTAYKIDLEQAAAIEPMLDPDRFAELFERKVSIAAKKAPIEKLLGGETDDDPEVIEAIRSVVGVVETPRLAAQIPKPPKAPKPSKSGEGA